LANAAPFESASEQAPLGEQRELEAMREANRGAPPYAA
jgi:hypothetical protein